MRYILGIDQSTQGTKAALFDETGRVAAEGRRKHRQIVTAEGYIEHDPAEIMTQAAPPRYGMRWRAAVSRRAVYWPSACATSGRPWRHGTAGQESP